MTLAFLSAILLGILLLGICGLGLYWLKPAVSAVARVAAPNDRAAASMARTIDAGRYRPMLRLLAQDDFEYIRSSEPASRRLIESARAQRRRVFRAYLRSLQKDYSRLLADVRLMMVNSGVDRPELASALVRNRVLFTATMMRIQFRLGLHAAGVGTVDVSGLIGVIEGLSEQARSFTNVLALQPNAG